MAGLGVWASERCDGVARAPEETLCPTIMVVGIGDAGHAVIMLLKKMLNIVLHTLGAKVDEAEQEYDDDVGEEDADDDAYNGW